MQLHFLENTERIKITCENKTELRGIKNYLNRHVEGYMHTPRFKMKLWDGRETEYDNESSTIPLGLWKEAFKCCQEFGYPWKFINKNEFPLNREVKKEEFEFFIETFFKGFKLKGKNFETREYQLRCALNIIKNRYCNMRVPTSGGKTLIFAMYMFYLLHKHPKMRFLLIVPSTTLVSQFYDDIITFNWQNQLYVNVQEVFAEGNKPRTTYPDQQPNFVVGTYQSLVNEKKDYFKKFHSITVDECLHPDTPIIMFDNTVKLIKDIQIGELVKTINEETYAEEIKEVEFVYKNLSKNQQMFEIEMEDGRLLKITGNHKVFTSDYVWVKVEDLKGNEDILYIK